MRILNIALMMGVLFAGGFVDEILAQTGNLQLEPSGAQIELFAGHSSTTGFLVKAGPAGARYDKLILSLADWEFNRMGGVVYKEPGTTKRSAAPWLSIQPVTLPIAPGDVRLVRITIQVPDDVTPGVYTSSVLVTETPPALSPSIPELPGAPPKTYCAFTILITVRPRMPGHGVDLTMISR